MIFVTVGSMLPFDRLIRAMDAWAARNRQYHVSAQIGRGLYAPEHLDHQPMLTPKRFEWAVSQADVVVAHAGMGSLICAAQQSKPIVILPRRPELHETTSHHQIDTANRLRNQRGVFVVDETQGLDQAIEAAVSISQSWPALGRWAPDDFLSRIRGFLNA